MYVRVTMRYTRLFNAIEKLALARFSIALTMGITNNTDAACA